MLSGSSSSLVVLGKQGLRWLSKDSLTGWEEGWTGVPPQCPLTPRLHNSGKEKEGFLSEGPRGRGSLTYSCIPEYKSLEQTQYPLPESQHLRMKRSFYDQLEWG